MWVYWVLAIVGTTFAIGILGAILWALTRASDRIQMATVCLFASALLYFASAAQLVSKEGALVGLGLVLGLYAAVVYGVMAVLALQYKRWAWQASVAVLGLHTLFGVAVSPFTVERGTAGLVGLLVWLAIGAVGLWACLHAGTRQLVRSANSSGT